MRSVDCCGLQGLSPAWLRQFGAWTKAFIEAINEQAQYLSVTLDKHVTSIHRSHSR
jgi:hypothetical protein